MLLVKFILIFTFFNNIHEIEPQGYGAMIESNSFPSTEETKTTPRPKTTKKPQIIDISSRNSGSKEKNDPKTRQIEYPGYNGWYNNIGRPELGAVDTPLLRRWPAAYEDGVYKPAGSDRPSPLELSERLMRTDFTTGSRTGKNVLMVFFGQHIVEEILDAQRPACPPEYFNIKIPKGHKYNVVLQHTEMPVLRTRYDERTGHSPNNPRQQLNEITPYLDGGLIYGTSKTWSDYLRLYENGSMDPNGLLAYSNENENYPARNTIRLPMANPPPPRRHRDYIERHYTEKVDRFYKLGNPRGNENPFLLTFGILWFRLHNDLARRFKLNNPSWSGEKIYNEARKWVIAYQQKIVFYDWLPQWLGINVTSYEGYNPSVDPQIDQFFQAAAFRFGHTLVPKGVYLRDYGADGCKLHLDGRAIRLCNNYWLSENLLFDGNESLPGPIDIERLLMGMAVQLAEEEDHKIVEDLRGNVFGPLEFSRRDLMALNIQRGRDHGLPGYNAARKAYNLDPVTSIAHFRSVGHSYLRRLMKMYNNSFDNMDVWVAGIMETEDGPGELFRAVIIDQFDRIRNGDRFWFENLKNGLFTEDEVSEIMYTTFYNILLNVTYMHDKDIPKNVFRVPASPDDIHDNCMKNNVVMASRCMDSAFHSSPCFHAPFVTNVEKCIGPGTYDYFRNSEISFLTTFSMLTMILIAFVSLLVFNLHRTHYRSVKRMSKSDIPQSSLDVSDHTNMYTATEWSKLSHNRPVIIILDKKIRQIKVKNQLGHLMRALDLNMTRKITLFAPHGSYFLLLRVEHNYDLVLKFDSVFLRSFFIRSMETFLITVNLEREIVSRITTKAVLKQAVTIKDRQKRLEQFFRVVFSQAFNITHCEDEILKIDSTVAKEVIYTELTLLEFAEALSMRADSEFVKKIFNLVDMDKNGFISFREFIDMLVLFLKGTAEDKLKLMFDMYDINGTGQLKREDFANMLKSFMETVNTAISDDELDSVIHSMMAGAQIGSKETIDLQDFKNILGEFNDKLSYAELEFNVNSEGTCKKLRAGKSTVRSTFIGEVRNTVENLYADPNDLKSRVEGRIDKSGHHADIDADEKIVQPKEADDRWNPVATYIANKQLEIFWGFLYTVLLFGIFGERFYYYSILREHQGLRQITGYGVAVTRGSASVMMFAYSSMLVTMCQNTITILRDTVLQFYIPFDSAIQMHKFIALWALLFTILHVVGHGFNFYHISTQTADDLTCLFRNNFHATHELPKFHDWVWTTMTGITAVLLTIVTGIIFLCSIPIVRRRIYKWFAFGHSLYPVFYVLMVLHGSGRLIQEPFFHYFFVGPVVLFTIDKIFTATRKTTEIPLLKVELLPSGVTSLIFQKPLYFQYKSGQWVRISCPALGAIEYHPFTLSSAPHEPVLSVHVRAVGPWTNNLRKKLDPTRKEFNTLPRIHVDGPYGESHQNWDRYSISIMVAGGIGVTPFASILKDIVHKCNQKLSVKCSKIYFIWVTRSQKQFEWMVDILRDVEKADLNDVVSAHIFITQFYQKFDLRTILLYICERHFQKVSNKSLFTGLTAVTHFGRPNFAQFFRAIQTIHRDITKVGVFSCGSPTLTRSVDNACQCLNIRDDTCTIFQHHYKSF